MHKTWVQWRQVCVHTCIHTYRNTVYCIWICRWCRSERGRTKRCSIRISRWKASEISSPNGIGRGFAWNQQQQCHVEAWGSTTRHLFAETLAKLQIEYVQIISNYIECYTTLRQDRLDLKIPGENFCLPPDFTAGLRFLRLSQPPLLCEAISHHCDEGACRKLWLIFVGSGEWSGSEKNPLKNYNFI